MNEPKIPVFLAVGLWSASALAVITYTAIAFRETATGIENFSPIGKGSLGLVAETTGLLEAELTPNAKPVKPLNRNKFNPSH